MNIKHFAIVFSLLCTFSLTSCNKTVEVIKISDNSDFCKILKYNEENENYQNNIIEFEYVDANAYFNKISFVGQSSNDYLAYTIELKGNQLEVSYVDDSEEKSIIKTVEDYSKLPSKTLYLSTDMENMIVSVPSVYDNIRVMDSIQTRKEFEKPVTITKGDETFYITYAFPKDLSVISEFYYIKSKIPIITINSKTTDLLIRTELSGRFRFLQDGFYQTSYETYYPTGEGNYFRNCANYVAMHFITHNRELEDTKRIKYFDYFAYASTYLVNLQISEYGFFETKSRSEWLFRDFLINNDFYDTRFNADNAELNILLYEQFGDVFFLDTLNTYGQFFIKYADEYSYKTERGILVEDYYNPKGGLPTHSSLNHQLANLNVLLSLYNITNNEEYLNTAMLMLYGIEDTKKEWILENSDLNYALYYNGNNNIMKDYPYLTYNDLFVTKERLNELGIKSSAIDELMDAKMVYMTNNNITGYMTYQ